MSYTKGKFEDGSTWKAVKYEPTKQVGLSTHEIHWSDDGECVAEVVHGEEDAMLIAAAPDLLEALKAIIKWSAHFPQAMNNELSAAMEAVNKAECVPA